MFSDNLHVYIKDLYVCPTVTTSNLNGVEQRQYLNLGCSTWNDPLIITDLLIHKDKFLLLIYILQLKELKN